MRKLYNLAVDLTVHTSDRGPQQFANYPVIVYAASVKEAHAAVPRAIFDDLMERGPEALDAVVKGPGNIEVHKIGIRLPPAR